MKKTYDWDIKLFIKISNNQQRLEIVASVHSNIHQIKLEIIKKLKLPLLDTLIDLYYRSSNPLKPISTLLQNQVKNGQTIQAVLKRIPYDENPGSEMGVIGNQVQNLSPEVSYSKNISKYTRCRTESAGLTIIASCTNSSCVDFNKLIEIKYGFGNFPILHLTAKSKCTLCPYKSQKITLDMMAHSILVQSCYYKLTGTRLSSGGIPIKEQTPFIKASQQRDILKLLNEHPWHIDMTLIIKHL